MVRDVLSNNIVYDKGSDKKRSRENMERIIEMKIKETERKEGNERRG